MAFLTPDEPGWVTVVARHAPALADAIEAGGLLEEVTVGGLDQLLTVTGAPRVPGEAREAVWAAVACLTGLWAVTLDEDVALLVRLGAEAWWTPGEVMAQLAGHGGLDRDGWAAAVVVETIRPL